MNGAQVGDLFMSLIHTCELCSASSFDSLIEFERHAMELAAQPDDYASLFRVLRDVVSFG